MTIHEMLVVRKLVNAYEVAYVLSIVQTLTMLLYHWYQGLFFFDVPKEGRALLLVNSLTYALSFTLFIDSMTFLNPVVALICLHAGISCTENLVRFILRQNMIWNVIIIKITATVILIVPGWIPETCLIEPPQTAKNHIDEDWMLDYRKCALEAFGAGLLLCAISRMSHILAKPGSLRHEAYISTYAYMASACLLPLFIITELKK